MHVVEVTYEDFNGDKITEKAHFHFSQDEMYLFLKRYRNKHQQMSKAVKDQDILDSYEFIRDFLTSAYGERSEDGRRFVKNADTVANLVETPLMDAITELVFSDEAKAKAFTDAVIPPKMREVIEKRIEGENKK